MQITARRYAMLLSFLFAHLCWGQSPQRVRDANAHSWWVYGSDTQFKDSKWGMYIEVQARRSQLVNTWQQLQSRDNITYKFSKDITGSIGYVWTRTSPYGAFPGIRATQEHRSVQQLNIKRTIKKVELEDRFRLEQRWIQAATGNYYRFQQRARYQLKISYPLSAMTPEGRQLYAYGGNEVFIHFGPNHGPSPFDQNRVMLGLGYRMGPSHKLEVGYMNQFLLQRNGRVEESNHTLRVQLNSTFHLGGSRQ